MLHPSYTELIARANEGLEPGDEPVVQSRYSIVCATAKRARQLVDAANKESDEIISETVAKPLSDAVRELDDAAIYIMTEEEYLEAKKEMEEEVAERVAVKLAAKVDAENNAAKLAAIEAAEAKNSDDDDDDDDDEEELDLDSDDE